MKKCELRVAIQEMDTYQFGLKNELHNKLTKVTSYVPKKKVIDLINQLEEPEQEKVVIPQFVADWIETMKQQNFTLGEVAEHLYSGDIKWSLLREYERWARLNFTKFARAWIDGYEVEKQEQWVVKDDTGYLSYLRFSIPDIYERETSLDKNDAYKFNNKSKADLIAGLVTGTVEEITK